MKKYIVGIKLKSGCGYCVKVTAGSEQAAEEAAKCAAYINGFNYSDGHALFIKLK